MASRLQRFSRVRRRRALVKAVLALAVVAATVTACAADTREQESPAEASGAASASPTPTPTPLSPVEELLAGAGSENACAVSFAGEGIADAPMLQTEGVLYVGLPIPKQDGAIFAGWYATPEDAAAFTVAGRVNGSEMVTCTEHQTTLYGSWKTPEENVAENARIPIMMYHQFTTKPEGEEGWLRGNYVFINDFDEHMNYIATGGFYLPTWDELNAFIDGQLFLPTRSVIITDDDADQSWFDLAVPVIDNYKLLSTSFMITADRQDPAPSPYVLRRSHTHDMHKAGDNGKGRMVNWTADQIAADLELSAATLGVGEVVAYPFGHYNDTTKQGVTQAGFTFGRTIEPGYVSIGTDKLALPVARINYGMGLSDIVGLIG